MVSGRHGGLLCRGVDFFFNATDGANKISKGFGVISNTAMCDVYGFHGVVFGVIKFVSGVRVL